MIFTKHHCALILAGQKTETRRLWREGDEPFYDIRIYEEQNAVWSVSRNGRKLWQVYQLYSIQPGRGARGLGYYKLLSLHLEQLWQLTEQGAQAEGCADKNEYRSVWNTINKTPATRWEANPLVWVLKFKLVTKGGGDD